MNIAWEDELPAQGFDDKSFYDCSLNYYNSFLDKLILVSPKNISPSLYVRHYDYKYRDLGGGGTLTGLFNPELFTLFKPGWTNRTDYSSNIYRYPLAYLKKTDSWHYESAPGNYYNNSAKTVFTEFPAVAPGYAPCFNKIARITGYTSSLYLVTSPTGDGIRLYESSAIARAPNRSAIYNDGYTLIPNTYFDARNVYNGEAGGALPDTSDVTKKGFLCKRLIIVVQAPGGAGGGSLGTIFGLAGGGGGGSGGLAALVLDMSKTTMAARRGKCFRIDATYYNTSSDYKVGVYFMNDTTSTTLVEVAQGGNGSTAGNITSFNGGGAGGDVTWYSPSTTYYWQLASIPGKRGGGSSNNGGEMPRTTLKATTLPDDEVQGRLTLTLSLKSGGSAGYTGGIGGGGGGGASCWAAGAGSGGAGDAGGYSGSLGSGGAGSTGVYAAGSHSGGSGGAGFVDIYY